MNILKKVR